MSTKEIKIAPVAELKMGDFYVIIVGKDPGGALELIKETGFKLPKKPFHDFEEGWSKHLLVTGENRACILTVGKLSFNKALRNGKNITIQCHGIYRDVEQAQREFVSLAKEEARHGID